MNIYIHIPFCTKKCGYCTFASGEYSMKRQKLYTSLLENEITQRKSEYEDQVIDTVFFGGGTPSKMGVEFYQWFLGFIRNNFTLSDDCEITIEMNPEDVHTDLIQWLLEAGVTRFSMWVQSFQQKYLDILERQSTPDIIKWALQSLASFPDAHWSLDLMFGLPNQTLDDFRSDLEQAITYKPEHISCYQLTLDPQSPLFAKWSKEVKEDVAVEMYSLRNKMLSEAGYTGYEISNFAQDSQSQSKHNTDFWLGKDYLGFGLGAVGQVGKKIRSNASTWEWYVSSDYEREVLTDQEYILSFLERRFRLLKSPVTIFDLQPLKGKVQESLRKDIWNRLYDYAQYYPQYYIVGKKSIEYIDSWYLMHNTLLHNFEELL